ncbi:hypothetical protein F5B19DRAFT_467919 [Rostrohypoxylon terebratum]|nr:hypothetical protein F5B19DRAFT_467919 [Rostrohypoxylon terebratum]
MYCVPRQEMACPTGPTTVDASKHVTSSMKHANGEPSVTDQQSISTQSISPSQQSSPQQNVPRKNDTVKILRVAEILDAAREGSDLSQPLKEALEQALCDVWARIIADPETYVMTRDEFAIFNFFQHLQLDDDAREIGRIARKNYWDHSWGSRRKSH